MIEKTHLSQNLKVLKNTGKPFTISGVSGNLIQGRAKQIGIIVQYERVVIVNLKGKTESRIGYIVNLKEVIE